MPKIAIDIALLPDKEMTDKSVEISKKQSKKFSDKILLNDKNCLPHISLAMGVINVGDIEKISQILTSIASLFTFLKLNVADYKNNISPLGNVISEFTIEKTKSLYSLHIMIMEKLKQYLTYCVSIDMVYSPPKVEKITLHWIKGYLQNSSFKKFKPHVTLGYGQIENIITPIAFTASTIALCHLGNYCTCRKVLHSVELNNKLP